MFIILIYLFSEIFPGVSRGPICSSCTRAHSPVWPPLHFAKPNRLHFFHGDIQSFIFHSLRFQSTTYLSHYGTACNVVIALWLTELSPDNECKTNKRYTRNCVLRLEPAEKKVEQGGVTTKKLNVLDMGKFELRLSHAVCKDGQKHENEETN